MAETRKRQVKAKADAINAVNKAQAAKKAESGTPVSGKNADKVKVFLRNAFGIDYPMPDGRVVSIQCSTFNLRGLDTGVIDLSRVQENIIDAADWEHIVKTYGNQQIFKNGHIHAEPVNISIAEEKAVVKEMQENLPPLALTPVDPNTTKSKPRKD